ncbi:MAG TPA: hypothetical protein VF223_07730 [Trebonia sp.]
MRITNGAAAMAGRAGKGALGIVVAGGAAAFVLAAGGIAMASPLPAHVTAHGAASGHPAGHLNHRGRTGTPGAGNGKLHTHAPGQSGWNRVNNNPGTTGGQGGLAPGSTSAPGLGGSGGQGGQAPTDWNIANNQGATGGQGGQVPTGWNIANNPGA